MSGFIRRRELASGPRYYPILKVGDQQVHLGGFKSRRNAEARLRQAESGALDDMQPDITFSAFAQVWLRDYASLAVKPSTYQDYETVIRRHLVPALGKKVLRRVSPGEVQTLVAKMSRSGLSPRTVNKSLTVLKSMLNKAEAWRYISENPARYIQRPRQERREMDFLEPGEVARFLEAANDFYRPLFSAAVLTGARQGELFALRWGDYDQGRQLFFIRRTYQQEHGFTEPKSRRSVRAVRVSPELAGVLTPGDPEDLIFPNSRGGPINRHNLVRREFHPALKRAKVRQVRFHDLRHTYAALMISLGVNIKWLQEQMGHASITTTLDRYGHLLSTVEQDAPERLDALIFSPKIASISTPREKIGGK